MFGSVKTESNIHLLSLPMFGSEKTEPFKNRQVAREQLES